MKNLVIDVVVGMIAIEAIRIYGKIKYEKGRSDTIDQIYEKGGCVVFMDIEKEIENTKKAIQRLDGIEDEMIKTVKEDLVKRLEKLEVIKEA